MEWFFSGLLVMISAGITGYTGYLLWRLFGSEPLAQDGPAPEVVDD